jgi:MscS family membrane protein
MQEWLLSLLWVAAAFVVGRLSLWFNRRFMQKKAQKTTTKYDDIFLQCIDRPMMLAIMLVGIWFGANALHPAPAVAAQINSACRVLLILCTAWFAAKFTKGSLSEYIENNRKTDKHLAHNLRRAAVGFIWLIAVIAALQTLGVNLRALLATLGIGGAALALAAQDILKNIIGGITLVIDRPFKIGDYVRTKEMEGTVLRIGLRSVSVRTLENRIVTIPNHKMTDAAIENVSSETSRRITLKLGLVYQTTPAKMQAAIDILTRLPQHIHALAPNTIAAFSGYSDFALEITYIYYVKKKTEVDVYNLRSAVNIAILEQFLEAGLEFAYPTQTIVVNKADDSG